MFKESLPQRGFSSLGQSGRLSPPPLLLTASAHWRFCLSGTCTKTAYYLYVYFVIVVFKSHFQFQTSRHIVHIRYMLIRSFLIQRPPKCLKCLSFDILTCWYYETCWASVNDSAGDLASLTSTEIYFALVFRNHLDSHEPVPPSYIWLELFRLQKGGK